MARSSNTIEICNSRALSTLFVLIDIIEGGVTRPEGFYANGVCCGIKQSGKMDLALMISAVPAVGVAVFTKNSIKAAPILVSQNHLRNNTTQAFVVNSGNANCFTGKYGRVYAIRTAELFGKQLDIPTRSIIVASTGIIGQPLPFKKIQKAAKKIISGLSKNAAHKAAKAILTTDLKTKEHTVQIRLGGKKVTIGSCAKGAGMIAPNMATMLAFLTTDVNISAPMLKKALKQAVDQSFNCITIDACMSTNDMVVIMANGLAKNKKLTKQNKDFHAFCKALNNVCLNLAQKIILDGEGASKFIEIHVVGAKSESQAKKIGLAVANSNLVKIAAFGNSSNWGRIAAAVGSTGFPKVTAENIKINFSPFTKKHIVITIDLNLGKAKARVYTSDLSYRYVKINVEYN